jgi:putative transposase
LYGSLPAKFLEKFRYDKSELGRRFIRFDQELDTARTGPLWLKTPEIAEFVMATLHKGEAKLGQYLLHAYVIMANHVHLLFEPRADMARIMKGIKGVTSQRANRILGRTGKVFWQDESFDHWVRNEAEEQRIRKYIENNPVKAGLVRTPEDWLWSSVRH